MCKGAPGPPLGARLLALEHGPKGVVRGGGDALAGAAAVLGGGLAVAEREANKEALAHLLFTIRHTLEGLLLVVDLLVLGHVCLVAEVIKVAGVRLRVQLGDEGCAGLAQGLPLDFGEVLVVVDVLDVGEPTAAGVDSPGLVSDMSPWVKARVTYVVIKFQVRLLRK